MQSPTSQSVNSEYRVASTELRVASAESHVTPYSNSELETRYSLATRYSSQSGFTLLELMIAAFVLTFGLLALTALFITATGNNGRSRVDSTATMLSQAVIEQITAVLARGGPAGVTDCASPANTWTIDTNVGGAPLSGSSIDFTQSQSSAGTGYYMNYVVCNGGGEESTQAVYDVRWNITTISNNSYLVTVGARPKNMTPGRFTFALPVTLRTFVGPQ